MAKAERNIGFEVLYKTLRRRFGFLNWWPGETKDEIIIGAILTQNTNWKNVEKAICNLKYEKLLDLESIAVINAGKLERLIRPSGFYRQKAARLMDFARYAMQGYGGVDGFFKKGTQELRKELLGLNGIGKETADSIILYAAGKPIFVIDAYTRRILNRMWGIPYNAEYDDLRFLVEQEIRKDVDLYKDFHAQLVELAKRHCRKEPCCSECPVNKMCSYGSYMQKLRERDSPLEQAWSA